MLNYIFLALEQRLKTIPELREVDWFANQYAPSEDEQIIYAAPACYLEIAPIPTSSTEKKRVQSGQVTFRAHVVTELYKDNDDRFASAAMEHFSVVNSVYDSLLGYSAILSEIPGNEALANTPQDQMIFNSITRTLIDPDHNLGHLMLTIQTFTMLAYDFTAIKTYTKVNVGAGITTRISHTL